MQSPSFRFSPDVEYACTLCGDCCRERWRIPLDAATRDSLARRDWSQTPLAAEARGDREFFVEAAPTLSPGAAFKSRDGACVLLGDDSGCEAHRHFGEAAKGIVCRLFPYLFVEAPEAVYVGYSFCCRSVRKPGEPASAERTWQESLESRYAEARHNCPGIHYQKAPSRVALTSNIEIPWEGYLHLEQGLLELLSRSDAPFGYHLIAGQFYLNLCGLFLRRFPDDDDKALQGKVEHYVEAMRKEGYTRVDRIAHRARRRWGVRRYVLSVMLGLHKAGMKARAHRQATGKSASISRLRLLQEIAGRLLSRHPSAELPPDLFSEAVGRYLRHVIWRKGLALGRSLYRLGGLSREYAMLLVAYALIEYFARSLAPRLGAEEATSEALRIVERDFVLHAGRDETGPAEEERDSYELFLGLFDSLAGSKAFAPSMVGQAKESSAGGQ